MKSSRALLSLIALIMTAAFVACGGSSSTPPPPAISVAFSAAPPNSLQTNAAQALTATVKNDSANKGVTWSVTCGSAACGGFSANATASGAPTTYTAPAAIPTGNTVTVTATSVADATKKVSAVITITAPSPLADGNYVFSLAGQDAAAQYLYYVAGAFTVSGGTITGGEQDFNSFNLATGVSDAITGGSVSTTADGNLQITLTTADNSVGVGGVETLNGTLVSNSGSKALITEFDASATSSGELDLQTSTSAGPGGYAFFVTGGDTGGGPATIGGVVNVDGQGTISGAGSVFDIDDVGNVLQNQPIDPSTTTSADAFGRVQVSLVLSTSGVGGIGLVGYVVDNNRIRLIENNSDPNDVFFGVMGGTAFAQGGNTGSFSAASIASSSFVIGTTGQNPNGFFQAAGVLTANADLTSVNGTINFNDLTGVGVQAPIAFVGTYTVDPTGRVTVQDTTDGVTLQIYLDGNGNGTVASMDNFDVLAGVAYLQTGAGSFNAASFSGNYGLNTFGTDFNFLQNDSVGPVAADGVAALNGTVDQNSLSIGTPAAGLALTGDFVADPSGVFTTNAGITGLDVLNPANQDAFTYYLIDNQRAVAIETDPNQLTLGYFELVH